MSNFDCDPTAHTLEGRGDVVAAAVPDGVFWLRQRGRGRHPPDGCGPRRRSPRVSARASLPSAPPPQQDKNHHFRRRPNTWEAHRNSALHTEYRSSLPPQNMNLRNLSLTSRSPFLPHVFLAVSCSNLDNAAFFRV